MRDKFPIGVSEGERVFAGVGGSVGGFCVESFTLSEMGYKLLNGSDKFTIYGIDGYLEKEEGLPTRSELFLLIFLAPEWILPLVHRIRCTIFFAHRILCTGRIGVKLFVCASFLRNPKPITQEQDRVLHLICQKIMKILD